MADELSASMADELSASMADEAVGPLAGVRVIDLTSVIMGPLSTQVLGDLGADVISIEDGEGNSVRSMGPGAVVGLSGVSMNLLRNKRSLALDLKAPRGREAFLRLAATADVMVTNLRPGPLSRLGLSYEDVSAVRPDVVFCRAHGYPTGSGKENAPAYDDIIQSASGIGELFARQGHEPSLLPTLVADKVAGLTIASAILAALFHRAKTGAGQCIEVPMIDVMRAFVLVEHGAGAIPVPPVERAGYQRILTAQRRPQATVDGWINVLPNAAGHYDAVFRAGGREDLVGDPRAATREGRIGNSETLYRDVASVLVQRTTAAWLELCAIEGIPAAAAATLDEIVAGLPEAEHPTAGRYKVIPHPVRYSATPASVRLPAPRVGEHSRTVLAEIGYDDAELDALEAEGTLAQRRPGSVDEEVTDRSGSGPRARGR